MCELFALSAKLATNVQFSLETFLPRGGRTAQHRDGWGIAYYRDGDAQILREPMPAAGSAFAAFVRDAEWRSDMVISHVRKATAGDAVLRNTHPFARELGGQTHVFAHNGHVAQWQEQEPEALGSFKPVGSTDSEWAFCVLMAMLAPLWRTARPSMAARHVVVAAFAEKVRSYGVGNFLYTDGEALFVHGHRHPREQDDGPIVPGLHMLQRRCTLDAPLRGLQLTGVQLRGDEAEPAHAPQQVTLVATVPLTDEAWIPLPPEGTLLMLAHGEVLASS